MKYRVVRPWAGSALPRRARADRYRRVGMIAVEKSGRDTIVPMRATGAFGRCGVVFEFLNSSCALVC